MLDIQAILNTNSKLAKDLVGQYLSTLPDTNPPIPSVIKEHPWGTSNGTNPPYPFMTVAIAPVGVRAQTAWVLDTGVKEVSVDQNGDPMTPTDLPYYTIEYLVDVQFRGYGKNSLVIMEQLKMWFLVPSTRDRINQELQSMWCTYQYSDNNVVSTPDILATEIKEGSLWNVTYRVRDEIIDYAGSIIEQIQTNGSFLYYQDINEEGAIPINITVP